MPVTLLVHDIRSCHNVGSLLRTADGLGVDRVIMSGYTPYPRLSHDERLPHIADKISRQISKTALGAELTVTWEHAPDIAAILETHRAKGYRLCALEQTDNAVTLEDFCSSLRSKRPQPPILLLIGREVEGIDEIWLHQCDEAIVIPMQGKKESFNVSVAAAIALYEITQALES